MRTMLAIVSTLLMMYASLPQRVLAQVRATALVTATVIPSVSIELVKPTTFNRESSGRAMNVRGTGNILIAVDSKEVKSSTIYQLTTEKPAFVTFPPLLQTKKISIIYLSS